MQGASILTGAYPGARSFQLENIGENIDSNLSDLLGNAYDLS